ncbi:Parp14, partial [Symbiodinium necroappetens]
MACSEEWSGVESHVHTLGGSEVQDLQILRIERNENWHLYSQYASYRNGLEKQNEMYLFRGSPDTTNQIMDDGKGFDTAYASQEFNAYGVGNYFAADLRLSLFFIREQPGRERQVMLCRVACGKIGTRDRVLLQGATAQDWRAALIRPENKQAPDGCQSATSRHRRELVVYKQNHAHPAYKITLLYTEPIRNPYDHPALFNQLLAGGSA